MKPYYQDEWVTIYHADCREALKELPDNSVDLVLTDPPYGLKIIKARYRFGYSKNLGLSAWDESPLNADDIALLRAKSKNQIIFGGNYIADLLPASRCWLVWDKADGYISDCFADAELAWCSFDKTIKVYRFARKGFFVKVREKLQHPTQKPEEVISRIILDFSEPETLILDPFLGSGTTAACAKKLGRRCIGIEIEEKYCEIAANRCRQSVMQLVTDNGKKCYVCGAPIKDKRSDSDYCSNKCRQAAYRQRLKK